MNSQSPLADNPYALFGESVAQSRPDVRATFIRKTYTHLAAAIYAFAALEWFYFQSGFAETIYDTLFVTRFGMLIMFGGFVLVGWLANKWAYSNTSITMQYAGLGIYVFAQSIITAPLLYVAQSGEIELIQGYQMGVIPAAGIATLLIFGALTAYTWFTRADFSFLGAGLSIASFGIMALIVVSMVFGFHLGIFFSIAMVVFAALYILYDTSNVIHRYPADKHVAASLALFASVALLFWYVLQIFMSLSSRD